MKKNLFDSFLRILSRITHKNVLYISNTHIKPSDIAVKSKYGFWYCGNIFDQGDVAYGVVNNGTVEEFDTELVKTILSNLKKDYVFYDIGANSGWYTALASNVSNLATIHSFEPLEEYVDCIKETSSLNKIEERNKIYNFALSDTNGVAKIRLAGSGSSLEKDFLSIDRGLREIEIKTLDSFAKQTNLPNPDFIKIDVEGHEYKVLKGAEGVLEKSKPVLFIEIAYTLGTTGSSFVHADFENIFTMLEKMNYVPFISKDNKITKYSTISKPDGVFMFLFLNKEKHDNLLEMYTETH